MGDDSVKAQLKKLRDDLAMEAQRVVTFPSVPRELVQRVQDTAGHLGNVYLKCCAPQAGHAEILEELYDDALVEGHLTLADWREWIERQQRRPPSPGASAERRIHARDPSTVSVTLIRHHVRGEGTGVVVDEHAADRLTRDVSDGGVFVLASRQDLPHVTVGHVLHVSLPGGADAPDQKARASVIRRDDFGIALRWIVESPLDRGVVDRIVRAIRARPPR